MLKKLINWLKDNHIIHNWNKWETGNWSLIYQRRMCKECGKMQYKLKY